MKVFLKSLLSRKLWISILGVAILILNKQYTEATAVIIGYLGINGLVEVKAGSKPSSNSPSLLYPAPAALDAADTSEVWSGAAEQRRTDLKPVE